MRVVTGGTGFIGSHIDADVRIGRAECDLRDRQAVLDLFRGLRPTQVVHCAGLHGSSTQMRANHSSYLDQNISIDLNILYAAQESGVRDVLLLSSTTAFSPTSTPPLNETQLHEGRVADAFHGYAYSKRFAVEAVRAYQKDFGSNYKCVLLGNTYGPGMRFASDATIIGNLIYQMARSLNGGGDISLFGDGSDLRNFTFVNDLNAILSRLLTEVHICEPVIVSTPEVVTIKHVAQLVANAIGYSDFVDFPGPANATLLDKTVDSSQLLSLLPDVHFTPISDGIRRTVEWFVEQGTPRYLGNIQVDQ